MNELKVFLDACKKGGSVVTLRQVFPGRGKYPTGQRKEVKQAFVKAKENKIDGVSFDSKRGVFTYVKETVEN